MTAIYALSPAVEAALLGAGFGVLFVAGAATVVLALSRSERRTACRSAEGTRHGP